MRRVVNCLLLFCLGTATTIHVQAQSPFFQTYSLLKKSEAVQVNKLFQDSRGYVWVGTNKGLFRTDGTYHFLIEGTAAEPITALAEDSVGRIWMGSRSGKLSIIGPDLKPVLFEPPEGSAAAEISDILFDKKGTLWFSTLNDGLYYFTAERLYRLDDADGLPDIFVYDIEEDSEGNIWAGTDGGAVICRLQDRKVQADVIDYSDGLPDNIIRKIRRDGNNMLLATEDAGIVSFDPASNQVRPLVDEAWSFGAVSDVVVDESKVWIATSGSGLVLLERENQALSIYRDVPGLLAANTLLKDVEGNIWAGSRSALVRSFNNYMQFIAFEETTNVLAVAADATGGIWYATDEGLYYRKVDAGGRAIIQKKLSGSRYEKRKIISLYVDAAGAVWCGFYGEGAIRLDPATGKVDDISAKLRNGNVLSIRGSGNDIWLATLDGVAKVTWQKESITVQSVGKAEGLNADYIYQAFPDSRGRVWFASDREGVVMLDESGYHHYSKEFGLKAVYGFMEDANHDIWANVQLDGLYRLADNQFRKEKSDLNVNSLTNTRSGKILIVHDLGVDIQTPGDSTVRRMGDELGFAGRKANLNAITNGLDGKIYIGTDNGIVVFTEPAGPMAAPAPFISDLKAFNVSKGTAPGLELSHDENNVSISFIGFWYQNPSGLEFQYKIDRYDLDWITSRDRNAIYSSLPPGVYTFRVRVSDSEDFSRAADVSMGFTITPPFWRTTVFYLLVGLALALAGYSYIKWRERTLIEDNLELEQRVKERTHEIQRKNEEIQAQAEEIKVINESLERRVHERTHQLERKNKALEEYAFINAHNLRSPVASILGLINLLGHTTLDPDATELVSHMKSSAERLDDVVRSITESIEKGGLYDGFDELDDDGID